MSSAAATFKNKAHQRAYANGRNARLTGKDRFAPYDSSNRSSAHFRKAWLAGYDSAQEPSDVRTALVALLDVVKRSDADACPPATPHTTDSEWDAAVAKAERALAVQS